MREVGTPPMSNRSDHCDLLSLTTQIVSKLTTHQRVSVSELPTLIDGVYRALDGSAENIPIPPIDIAASVTPEYLICLEDGEKLKLLKRHLRAVYNMSPDDYRRKWGLPSDYPMVAPKYAELRRQMAQKIELGQTGRRKSGKRT